MARFAVVAALFFLTLVGGPVPAQVVENAPQQYDPYEARFGRPEDVDLHDIAFNPESYSDKAVRVKGTLERGMGTDEVYQLRSSFGERARIIPINEIAVEFENVARSNLGEEFQITGVVGISSSSSSVGQLGASNIYITFWRFNVRPRRERPGARAAVVSLETLVQKPGRNDGKLVQVVGQFRGHNLFGDLPARSSRASTDWVLRDELFAVWITEKKPKGDGFALDPKLHRDAGRWLEVVGRPETVGGVVYIRATSVSLTAPKVTAVKEAPPPAAAVKPRPTRPPMMVFSLPLDGDREVPPVGIFYVQFNNDMDEETFRDRVVLRYVGPRRVGDREFVGLKLSYDGGRRALAVDPGDALRQGRDVEIVLLAGIRDVEGQELQPRPGREFPPGIVEGLRYRVAPGLLGGN
jgi:hypothetical protein